VLPRLGIPHASFPDEIAHAPQIVDEVSSSASLAAVARLLADQHDRSGCGALSEYRLGGILEERTTLAAGRIGSDLRQGVSFRRHAPSISRQRRILHQVANVPLQRRFRWRVGVMISEYRQLWHKRCLGCSVNQARAPAFPKSQGSK
jgi:hypothetical protein